MRALAVYYVAVDRAVETDFSRLNLDGRVLGDLCLCREEKSIGLQESEGKMRIAYKADEDAIA